VYTLVVHAHARDDVEKLWQSEPRVAARLEVLLQEIKGDQQKLSSLLDHNFGERENAPYHVSRWQALWAARGGARDLWRLKVWDLERIGLRYRVIYAYEIRLLRFHVLAVLPRDWDYDLRDDRSRRILDAYEDLR
jgi:hypothetical protein